MDRTYLYVAPEEYAEVKACGALWDDQTKRWYISSGMSHKQFSDWLEDQDEPQFGIACEQALVASAHVPCIHCRQPIEVITIYCESGTDCETGEQIADGTVSNIWAMDDALSTQLTPWPFFRLVGDSEPEAGCYANHCPRCQAVQAEYLLHDEPGDVFFGISQGQEPMQFTPLIGGVCLSGDFAFGI